MSQSPTDSWSSTFSHARLVLVRCGLRHWRLAWRQQLALLAILALGTSVYLAMRLANQAALGGFQQFADGLTRQPDWTLSGAAGPFDQKLLREMRSALGSRPAVLLPLVEDTVTEVPKEIPTGEGQIRVGKTPTLRLVGMDWVGLMNLATSGLFSGFDSVGEMAAGREGGSLFGAASGGALDASILDRLVMVSAPLAKRLDLSPGKPFPIILDDHVTTLVVGGVLSARPGLPSPPEHLLLMDLPAAQRLLKRTGQLDRVEVLMNAGGAWADGAKEREAITDQLTAAAQGRWLTLTAENRRSLADTMTGAFRLNLTILSLLALFVGGYLIFQALDGVVLRRRQEIGVLKSMGVTARAIQWAFLIESALLGLLGGVLGLGLGWLGALAAVGGVSQTVTMLYGATSSQQIRLTPFEISLSMGLALGVSLVAAWWPARQAAQSPPAQVMNRQASVFGGGGFWQAEWIGWALLLIAPLLSQLPAWRWQGMRVPLGSYSAALFWLLGAGLAAGSCLRWLAAWGRRTLGESVPSRVALSYLVKPSVRHRFAVAALASAIAMTSGMAVMVGSFDFTMRGWIERSMKADLYVSSLGAQSASSTHQITPDVIKRLSAVEGVASVVTLQVRPLVFQGASTLALGVDGPYSLREDVYAWVTRPSQREWWVVAPTDAALSGTVVPGLINESFGERFLCRAGDVIQVPTPLGDRAVRIVGVHADYGNERGAVSVDQSVFREWFQTDKVWRVALDAQPHCNVDALRDQLQAAFPGLAVFTNAHLREEGLRMFRQTFSVTYALELIGVVVAMAGLGLALASLLLERRDDLKMLRSLGLSKREIAQASAWEGLALATAGGLTGGLSGLWLGWLLIYRINKQAFGWTLSWYVPWLALVIFLFLVLVLAMAVASVVGRWGASLASESVVSPSETA